MLRYDTLGRLIRTASSAGGADYIYDGDAMIAEMNGNGSVLYRRYVYGVNPGTDDPLMWFEGVGVALPDERYLNADPRDLIVRVMNAKLCFDRVAEFQPYKQLMHIVRSSPSVDIPGDALQGSVDWIVDLLTGSVAVMLCVLAVVFVGFAMLTGRLPISRGIMATLGAFILLAAPIVAEGLSLFWQNRSSVNYAPEVPTDPSLQPRENLEPSDYDPYAGASLRGD